MTLEQLTHFLTVVQQGNYVSAARSLSLHPSTISKSISALERELNVSVFQRCNGDLRLTEAGRFLANEAPAVLLRFHGLEEQVRRLTGDTAGALSFTSPPHLYSALTDLYRRFVKVCPNVVWTALHTSDTALQDAMDAVLNGAVDFALLPSRELQEHHPDLQQTCIFTSPFVLVVGPNHPLAGRASVRLEELAGIRLLSNRLMRPDVLMYLSGSLINRGLTPPELYYIDEQHRNTVTGDFLFLQVAAEQGAAILPRIIAETHLGICRLLRIEQFDETTAPFHISLIWRESNRNPALLRLLELLSPSE